MLYTKYKIPFPFIDIFFILWRPKCVSKIHNHSQNGCYMFILKGNLKEEIYSKNLSLIGNNYFSTLDISYINDKIGYHRILNGNEYSYSLHFYHPKNQKTIYFN